MRVDSLAAATTGTGKDVEVSDCPWIAVYVKGTGTLSSGVITIEEADFFLPDVAPTAWASVTTINASGATGGGTAVAHLPVAAYSKLRARISTEIGGGGTVTVTFTGVSAR